MSYQPNINEPRVQKRIKSALGFVGACISDTKSHPWSTRYISKFVGRTNEDLGNWLRNKLLICTNDRWSKDDKICKEYIKNKEGYDELVSLIKQSTTTYPIVRQVQNEVITDWINNEYSTELKSKNFEYLDKSNRYWHNLQSVKRDYKKIVFVQHGLTYQYDIKCCAPTLILQYSQMLEQPMDLYLETIQSYMKDRKSFRTQLANDSDISEDLAKEIINALLMGAKLGNVPKSSIYQLLEGDKSRIEYLKQDPFITKYKKEVKIIWDYIKPTLPKTTKKNKNGKEITKPISSKQKAGVYFELERKVINSAMAYLKQTNNHYFLEHDGWVCTNEINQQKLVEHIKNSTGFTIQLDLKVLN